MKSYSVSPQQAARELLTRREARRSLLHFTTYTYPRYQAEPAHRLMCDALDSVVSGETDRLMIWAPPQHGKSELVSVRLPAYWLARRLDEPVILSSYGAMLADSKAYQGRELVRSDAYRKLFPDVRLDDNRSARSDWGVARPGGAPYLGRMLAVGVGGPVTGHGAMLAIIDDPFENWAQAQSQTIRDHVWEWWQGTFRTRVWEGGAIVLIMTRWHEDDLAGRLLQTQAARWRVLRLPALAETDDERRANNAYLHLPDSPDPLGRAPGAPLCPLRFSAEALTELKRDVGSMAWSAEYQGVPRAAEGNRFKRHWFETVEQVPFEGQRVRYWDKAATADGGCRTAGVLLNAHEGMYYVESVVMGQWSTLQRRKVMLQTAEADRARYENKVQIIIEQEPGSSGLDSIRDEMRMFAGFPVKADRPSGDKDVRMEPFAAQAEAGMVKLARGAWVGEWLEEICAIPNGQYRDQADATSGAFNALVKNVHQRKARSYQG